jgi:hypothetical protein
MLNLIIEFDVDWFEISISCKESFLSMNSQLQFGGTFVPIRRPFFRTFHFRFTYSQVTKIPG